ncbi:MAG: hypothetical protein OHK0013_44870 [Sandaracinaceae bacterium]
MAAFVGRPHRIDDRAKSQVAENLKFDRLDVALHETANLEMPMWRRRSCPPSPFLTRFVRSSTRSSRWPDARVPSEADPDVHRAAGGTGRPCSLRHAIRR